MNVISRLVDSVRRRGVVSTLGVIRLILVSHTRLMLDRSFDLTHRTETRRMIEAADTTSVESDNLTRDIHCHPTRPRPLRRLLREMAFPDKSVFVDLGCGKGRALIIAAKEGFERVVGIEFLPEACETSKHNIETVRRSGLDFEAEVICTDAAEYEFTADQNVLHLFNPFDGAVLERVMQRLDSSLARWPRRVWVIYQHPDFRSVIDAREGLSLVLRRTYGGSEFLVYSNLTPEMA